MSETIQLKPLNTRQMVLVIEGVSRLVQHNWSEKAKKMMRDKKAGKKTKDREPCDPQQEFLDATYFTEDGGYGVPATALKACVVSAAHKDRGIEKTLVRKSLFIMCDDVNGVIPMICSEPKMREDFVRVGVKQTDLRYRPEFLEWEVEVPIEYNADYLRPEDIANLFDHAGDGVGIGEHRPEKGGDWGRFQVKQKGEA